MFVFPFLFPQEKDLKLTFTIFYHTLFSVKMNSVDMSIISAY